MTKIILPVQLNPISRRKDKSVKLSFETRELGQDEILTLMALEGGEMWLCMSPEENEANVPDNMGAVELGDKTPSERLRSVLFVWYKQETDAGRYVGIFDNFRKEKMEKFIEGVKSKLVDNK